ncbi:unnamed protein product [Closterium sp. NIES-65]|nr:unnamed protein product [Closterium sp. NIES-65]
MRGSRLAARTWAPASANHWRLQGMQRPRERHAQCAALALAWWLAALATPAVVHAQVMAASQVTFLRDCQAAWGQVLAGWTSFNGRPITCQAATGIDCDTSGMITQM